MSSMVYATFLIVTAIAVCKVVEATTRPKDTAINRVDRNRNITNDGNEASSSAQEEVRVQEARTVICPPGYEPVEIYCYKINLQRGEQRQHQDLCFQSGGYLLEIGTSQENAALVKYMRSLNLDVIKPGALIIGLVQVHWGTDYSPLHTWMRRFGLPYTNWAAGYPHNTPCAFVLSSGDEIGKWGDAHCNLIHGGICEADPLYTLS